MRTRSFALALASSLACGPALPDETSATDAASSACMSTCTSAGNMTSELLTSGGTSGGTSGSFDPALCEGAALIELKDPSATPTVGPTWEPGESVTIGVTLHNPGPADFLHYPGLRVSTDHPGVTTAMPENWLYAILAGMDNTLTVTFTAAPEVAAPDTVTFTLEVVVLHQDCPGLLRLELPVDLH